jgi:hypothetical protein
MSKIALVLACSVVASVFTFEAQALPGMPAYFPVATPEATPVRGFCGLGFHRGPYGYCVRNGVPYGYGPPVVVAPPIVVAPPVVVAPRIVCPYPYHYSPGYGGCIR